MGNARRIKAAYGDGADNWIGKKIVLYPDEVQRGKYGDIIAGVVCVRVPRGAR